MIFFLFADSCKTLAVVGRMETVTQQLITELGDQTCLLDLRFGAKMACLNAIHLQGEVSRARVFFF